MKFCLLPLFATALPILLLQHATPADAAALCIPGIYCPDWPSSPPPPPACTCTAGNGGHDSSTSASGTTHHHHHHHSSSSSPSMPVPTFSPEPEPTSTPSPKPIPRPTSHTSSTTVTMHTSSSTPVTTPPVESTSYSSSHANPPATTTVTVTGGPSSGGSCNTGPVQCCNSVEPASSENASNLLGLLGIVLQGINIPIGINCNPISVLGLGSSGTCNAQTVCCENNSFNGLINIGCTPINIGL